MGSAVRQPGALQRPFIRQMRWESDFAAVMSFQKEIYELNFPGFVATDRFLRDFRETLREAHRSRWEQMFVAELEGRVVGFLWLAIMPTMTDPRGGYIKNIYVVPELRRQGLGTRLLEKADEWFQQMGAKTAQLSASVANPEAIRLYEKMGYETIRVRMEKRYR
jgi:ribosomal protein S18 acetylase RimI-like enzyme